VELHRLRAGRHHAKRKVGAAARRDHGRQHHALFIPDRADETRTLAPIRAFRLQVADVLKRRAEGLLIGGWLHPLFRLLMPIAHTGFARLQGYDAKYLCEDVQKVRHGSFLLAGDIKLPLATRFKRVYGPVRITLGYVVKRGRLPLTAMRSFEAAGRLLSFSRAAEELFVSQAAISRQIRELETFIGKPLFERLHRRIELTEAGQFLLHPLTASFDEIDLRLSQILAEPAQAVLRISVEPTFAGAWLVPHLNRFRQQHPDIDVAVDADIRLIEFRRDEAEMAIRHGAAVRSWPRAEVRHLLDCRMTPVLTPALLASGPPLASPADLRHHTLLHDYDRKFWANWFQAVGLPDLGSQKGPVYAAAGQAIHAAKLGHGVALGDLAMDSEDLRLGTLVRPFEIEVPDGAYWLVAPDFRHLSRPAKAFAAWIIQELAVGTKA